MQCKIYDSPCLLELEAMFAINPDNIDDSNLKIDSSHSQHYHQQLHHIRCTMKRKNDKKD